MVAPPDTPSSDWSGRQWNQQWDDDGNDKVGALVRRVEALETRFCDFRHHQESVEGQLEKQERDHQEFIEKQEGVFSLVYRDEEVC